MDAWGLTDPGLVREQNQDTYQIEALADDQLLVIVCDGMGGARAGNVASRLAVEVFVEEIRREYRVGMTAEEAGKLLLAAVNLANRTVYEQSNLGEDFAGMGTTLVAALVDEKLAVIANVGDSRAYYIGPDGIRRVTRDHSVVELMVQQGKLTAEQAKTYPGKNLITRAVGTAPNIECDLFCQLLQPGDCLYLCSDGLSNMVADQEILFEVVHGADKADACKRLLHIAANRGAPDNVTQILVAV